jgi:hypothetical protein
MCLAVYRHIFRFLMAMRMVVSVIAATAFSGFFCQLLLDAVLELFATLRCQAVVGILLLEEVLDLFFCEAFGAADAVHFFHAELVVFAGWAHGEVKPKRRLLFQRKFPVLGLGN